MKTTLNQIRKHSPCTEGWTKLLKSLNKTVADDEPLEMSTILQSNGLDDALWCLCSIEGIEKESRLFAVFCARQVQHLNDDPRVKNAIDVAERFAFGEATVEELNAAYDAATAAATAAAYAATNAYTAARSANAAYAAAAANAAATDAYTAATNAYTAARSANAAYAAYVAATDAAREEKKQKFIEMFC